MPGPESLSRRPPSGGPARPPRRSLRKDCPEIQPRGPLRRGLSGSDVPHPRSQVPGLSPALTQPFLKEGPGTALGTPLPAGQRHTGSRQAGASAGRRGRRRPAYWGCRPLAAPGSGFDLHPPLLPPQPVPAHRGVLWSAIRQQEILLGQAQGQIISI